jgi:predicted short-subunit dehydrogenase-like oxidoreductase (DUF2520 family)
MNEYPHVRVFCCPLQVVLMTVLCEKNGTSDLHRRHIAIIGAGVVGTTLGVALSRCGYAVSGVADINAEAAQRAAKRIGTPACSTDAIEISKGSNCILITTPDDAIASTCEAIASGGGFMKGDIVLHCSGALNSDALNPARDFGASVASVHPIGVFADVEDSLKQLSHLAFSLEGQAEAVGEAEAMVKALGGHPFRVTPEQKVLIHIAACLTANYAVTLTNISVQLLHRSHIPVEKAVHVLTPLLQGAVTAIEEKGIPKALTGPIARGDTATIQRHIETVRPDKELAEIYALLGMSTIPVALEKGSIDERTAMNLRALFKNALEGRTED